MAAKEMSNNEVVGKLGEKTFIISVINIYIYIFLWYIKKRVHRKFHTHFTYCKQVWKLNAAHSLPNG